MNENKNLWINAKDLVKTNIDVTAKNATTHLSLDPAQKIEVVEINDNGLVLKLPRTAGTLGHLMMITIARRGPTTWPAKPVHPFNFTAKIIAIETLDKQFNTATLQFYQFNEAEWRVFLNDCLSRQTNVNRIVKKVQE